MDNIKDIAKSAKEASLKLLGAGTQLKNTALEAVRTNLELHNDEIFEANKKGLDEEKSIVK